MAEQLAAFFQDKMPPEIAIFIISMLPVLELRGGLIAAAVLGVDFWIAFPICVIGNMLPIPFILLFIRKIFDWMKKTKLFNKIAIKLEERAKKKADAGKKQKYKLWGLYVLVAVPLPGTGGWTGALVADIMDIRIKHAFPVITAGVISAGIIMSLPTYIIPEIVKLFA